MKWKAVIRWTVTSMFLQLFFVFVGSILHGMLNGFADLELTPLNAILFSVEIFIPLYFIDIFYLFAIMFSAAAIWAFLSLRYPRIEIGERKNYFLFVYCLGYMVVFWYIMPIIPLTVFWGGIFAFISIFLPRFISKKLAFGVFFRKQNDGRAFENEVNAV